MDKNLEVPRNKEAECSVIGDILTDNDSMVEISEIITADDFYFQSNRSIYATIAEMYANKEPVDMITLCNRLGSEELGKVGGVANITMLAACSPSARNAVTHAKIVADCSKRRKLMAIIEEAKTKVSDMTEDTTEILSSVQETTAAIMLRNAGHDVGTTADLCMGFVEWMNKRYAMGKETGIPTGLADLQEFTHGWQDDNFIVVAGRPSMGKTALALNFASTACKNGKGVLIFSLEMGRETLMARIAAAECGIDAKKVMNPAELSEADFGKIIDKAAYISDNWNLHVEYEPSIKPSEMAAKARRCKVKYGIDLIIIDYIQLMSGEGSGGRAGENRQQEISFITRELKKLAGNLNVPVIALSQLSRSVEMRQNKRPMLSDLRESGSIEQDADIVLMLYRDEYYNPDGDKFTELIIAKNRNGEIGMVKLFFISQFTKFADFTNKYS